MPVEPGLVDTNVLVYALDADSPHHAPSRTSLEAAQGGAAALYVTSQILCEFYSIVTHVRRVARPRAPAAAIGAVADFVTFLRVLPTPAHAVQGWLRLLDRRPVVGSDIFDLQIIATMQANPVQRIYTFNPGDFMAFSELTVVTP